MNDVQNASEFDTFWEAYPLKTGKGHARKAFERAMKKTTLEQILSGIELYKAHKPDWKAFKHPATWLNGECWEDEYPQAQEKGALPVHKVLMWQEKYKRDPKLVPDGIIKLLNLTRAG